MDVHESGLACIDDEGWHVAYQRSKRTKIKGKKHKEEMVVMGHGLMAKANH